MTDRYVIRLNTQRDREKAMEAIRRAPDGYRLLLEAPRRSTAQSDKMHAMIRDVAAQVTHIDGLKHSIEDWKILFMDALNRETRMTMNLDGTGLVALGRSTAELKVSEMQDMILLITAFGDQHQVKFKADAMLEASYSAKR